jgi:hypothetical protein
MKSKLALAAIVVLPVLMNCSAPSRGTSSTGGTTSAAGNSGAGGSSVGSSGGSGEAGGSGSSGGATQLGGATAQGGSVASGGVGNVGGKGAAGGTVTSGGVSGSGGAPASGGATGAGGAPASGGATGAGGAKGTGGTAGAAGTGPQGPCDIYQAANTPCSGAHSTVRALYASYTGALYQVLRASDKTTKDILVGSGGYADTSVQDSFCSGTTCTIPIIYDQSPNGNHLRVTWFSHWLPTGGIPANATGAKITLAGHTVYGIKTAGGFGTTTNVAYRTGTPLSGTAAVTKGSTTVTFSTPQTLPANSPLMFVAAVASCGTYSCPMSYTATDINAATTVTLKTAYDGPSAATTVTWNQATKAVVTGDNPEAMYSVFDAKNTNAYCCFDYGNAEQDGVDDGAATMEALYFGSSTQFQKGGAGSGPWMGADIENGMFECDTPDSVCTTNTSITGMSYVTGMLKGPSGNTMVLKAGNAQSGKLETKWNGKRPAGYSPMKKGGAIILASGGDGSTAGTGTWFEGAITVGLPTDATDDAVQANVVAAGYGK